MPLSEENLKRIMRPIGPEKAPRKKRAKRETTPEKDVLRRCMARLGHLGWRAFRRNVGAVRFVESNDEEKARFIRFSEPNQADIWGKTRHGRHFEIEIKRPGKVPTAGQMEWLRYMNTSRPDDSVAFWVTDAEAMTRIVLAVERGGYIWFDDEGPEFWLMDEQVEGLDPERERQA
jgi:hypothetical protein